jgi:pseudouridine-5'-phosphate glycosidase
MNEYLQFSAAAREARSLGKPLVALESTIIAHGLPYPVNLDVAAALGEAVRESGAEPVVIGIMDGRIRIGLEQQGLERLARDPDCLKVSRRDIAVAISLGINGATTVAGTMYCAALAGIEMFATGGIGGVHRGGEDSLDISADLRELGRTPVTVVCAGAKSILDLPRTLEVLETEGVPVLGFGTAEFPAFHYRSSGLKLDRRFDAAADIGAVIRAQRKAGLDTGVLICNPVSEGDAIPKEEVEAWISTALEDARRSGITGKAETPYVLKRLVELSDGRTVATNRSLAVGNARLAGEIAMALASAG